MNEVPANQLILYITLGAAIIGIVAGAYPKLLKMFGQSGEALLDRLERQRSTAKAIDDADITELNRGIENLQKLLREERSNNDAQRALISNLYLYILAAQRDPNNLQMPVPDPKDYLAGDEAIEAGSEKSTP